MLIGIIGPKGSGKTLFQSILGNYIHMITDLPLWANYGLMNSEPIKNTKQIWTMKNGIFCFDEVWVTMDARLWKYNNLELTYWIMQIRHRDMLVLYTAQHRSEIEKRFRLATDIFVVCTKEMKGDRPVHKYTFMEPDLMNEDVFKVGRSYLLFDREKYYNIYDTKELVWPIKYIKLTQEEIENLSTPKSWE